MTNDQNRLIDVLSNMIDMIRNDPDWAETFDIPINDMLDDLRDEDAFGTEGQVDPRGDGREKPANRTGMTVLSDTRAKDIGDAYDAHLLFVTGSKRIPEQVPYSDVIEWITKHRKEVVRFLQLPDEDIEQYVSIILEIKKQAKNPRVNVK